MKKKSSSIFCSQTIYRTMTSGWQGASYFRRLGRELASKPAISFQEKLGACYRKTIHCHNGGYIIAAVSFVYSEHMPRLHIGVSSFLYNDYFSCFQKTKTLVATDSTIAPPQNQRFSLTNVSWLLDTRKDDMKNTIFIYFLVCKGQSNDDVVGARGTVFQEIRPGAGLETGDSVKEMLAGLP